MILLFSIEVGNEDNHFVSVHPISKTLRQKYTHNYRE